MTPRRYTFPPVLLGVVLACAIIGVVASQSRKPQFHYGFTEALVEDASPTDARAASLGFAKGVADSLGLYDGATADVFPDALSTLPDFRAGRIDVLAMSTREFLAAEQQLPIEPVFVWDIGGQVMTTYVLLSRATDLNETQIRGKAVVVQATNRRWNLADPWLDSALADAGITRGRSAFASVRYVSKRSHAALAVYFGQADYAVETLSSFRTAVELNPQLGRTLKIVAQSSPLLTGLVCAHAQLPASTRRLMAERLTRLHESVRYRQTFLVLRVTRIVAFEPSQLESVRALIRRRPEQEGR